MSPTLYSIALLASASLSLASPLSTNTDIPRHRYPPSFNIAPLNVPQVAPHDLLNDSYIVMLKEGVQPSLFASHMNFLQYANQENPLLGDESGLNHVFDSHVAKGYTGKFSKEVIEMIRRQPEVDYVEHDQIVYALETQKGAPWVRLMSVLLGLVMTHTTCHDRVLRVSRTARS